MSNTIMFSIVFHFYHHYIIKFIIPSLISVIPHHLFCLKCINKLNGIDEFASEVWYIIELLGSWGFNTTIHLYVFSRWAFIGSTFWKGIFWISIYCCFGNLSVIESYGEDNSASLCTCVLYFLCCIFTCCTFSVILKAFCSMLQILLISVWQIFG